MKTLYYLWLRIFKKYHRMDSANARVIDLVTLYHPRRPEFIQMSPDSWLVSPPKKESL